MLLILLFQKQCPSVQSSLISGSSVLLLQRQNAVPAKSGFIKRLACFFCSVKLFFHEAAIKTPLIIQKRKILWFTVPFVYHIIKFKFISFLLQTSYRNDLRHSVFYSGVDSEEPGLPGSGSSSYFKVPHPLYLSGRWIYLPQQKLEAQLS